MTDGIPEHVGAPDASEQAPEDAADTDAPQADPPAGRIGDADPPEGPEDRVDETDGDRDGSSLGEPSDQSIEAEGVVEAILFASDSPLPPNRVAQIMGVGDARSVRKHVKSLNERYGRDGSAFRIEEIAGGYQMLTLQRFNPWLAKLQRTKQESRLSPAALETLAIVAYKQPVLRAEIEAVRGVTVGEVLNRLREMNLIKIVGRDEQIGRPMLYGTTRRFLEVFGLASLKDLPTVEELKPPE